MILLQATAEPSPASDTFIWFLLSTVLLIVLAASGRVQLGFKVPGFPTPLPRSRKKILSTLFSFYAGLDKKEKRKFEQKVQEFIMRKQFIPRNIPQVTEEMRVLIAACAVQLTFGLPGVFLRHFKRILIYPDDYYSTINRQYHKGEVNPRIRAIVLSWKGFLEGYVNPTDGINLGLHEMTHALHLENVIENDEYHFFNPDALKKWREMAQIEMQKIAGDPNHFFRNYASTSRHEFLAVAVENFFEKSAEFSEALPQLYTVLTLLLNQDPLKNQHAKA